MDTLELLGQYGQTKYSRTLKTYVGVALRNINNATAGGTCGLPGVLSGSIASGGTAHPSGTARPAALAQVRMPPPEVRLNQQNPAQQQQQRMQFNRRQLGRRNSFDRDVAIAEEEQHLPAFVHLLPVVLPQQGPEPTLDELLVGAR